MSMLVLEPDDAIRRSLCEWLRVEAPGWSISEAASKEEAVHIAETESPRIILIDIASPGRDDLTAIQEIKAAAPRSAIVALVMYDDEVYRRNLASAGASASLLIWRTHRSLLTTIGGLLNVGQAESACSLKSL